ncbi:MAG: hypothetical protein RQ751_12850 [Longimicrobiales bacterium]|nr:hypothetical protein [Longimicrobiales bacterium]
MRPVRCEAPAGVEALAREGARALAGALEPAGRPRGGAFDLLAADGFVTWACEAALEQADPLEVLHALALRFAGCHDP